MATITTSKRPTRKFHLCFNADFRGYTHHCSRLTYSERDNGASGVGLGCQDPYEPYGGDYTAINPCS
jgi:hypothetical protein